MFDVHLSYGINETCGCLQNNLAFMPKRGLVDLGFRAAEYWSVGKTGS
jgi:hypothetical protein